MSGKLSAGILLFRIGDDGLEVLIGHPGGPFWANRHEGAWSIPKGLLDPGEDARQAARREYEEETGSPVPPGPMYDLGEVELRSGKRVVAWGVEGDLDADRARSNRIPIEWPRGTGRIIEIPEIDQFRWCGPDEAASLLNPAQVSFVGRLQKSLNHAE